MDRNGEQLLIDAVRNAERAAISLRDFAVCEAMRDFPRIWRAAGDVTGAEASEPEGDCVCVTIPAMLAYRKDYDKARYLAGLLRTELRAASVAKRYPRFRRCVIVYEHIYSDGKARRFIDHDNMEFKHIQDELEAAFLVNDSADFCSAFQCSHAGETDRTRIWVMKPERFPEWLNGHPDLWRDL